MMRKSARKYKYHKIYDNNNDWVNSRKGQITFGDMLFFLDPRKSKSNFSNANE